MKTSIKFLLVGMSNTIISFVVYAIFIFFFEDKYVQALVLSHVVGILNSYILNNKWTFQQKSFSIVSVIKFIFVYTLSFFLNLIVLYLLVKSIEINKLMAQAIALSFTTVFSYLGHRYWSFKASKTV